MGETTEVSHSNSKKYKFKSLLNIVILVIIFGLGYGFGSNKINLGAEGVFHKPVQNNASEKLDYGGVDEVYSKLKDSYDGKIEASKVKDGMKAGLVKAAGDPYTEYLNEQESKDFSSQLNGSFEGIGAELGKDNNFIVIIAPIDGFPAQKAGLKSRDIISKINGDTAVDISISDAVKKIRGPKGTKVKLEIVRDGKPLEIEITRDQINIPSVKTEITAENIGIIKLSRFGDDTVKLATEAANDMKTKNVKGVILDVRGNPGGLLDAAVGVSNIWLPKGKTILEEKRDGKVIKSYASTSNNPILEGVPTVVLIDGGSASASEIVAGALSDNNVATMIGVKSYGKGSVQEVLPLSGGGTLKVTVARWFTPGGRNIDKEGIEPSQKVEFSDDDSKAGKDPQKEAAIAKLR